MWRVAQVTAQDPHYPLADDSLTCGLRVRCSAAGSIPVTRNGVTRNGHGGLFGRASGHCWVFDQSACAIYDLTADVPWEERDE
jgi:hypothetical protein